MPERRHVEGLLMRRIVSALVALAAMVLGGGAGICGY
jgi:hypothetical protein